MTDGKCPSCDYQCSLVDFMDDEPHRVEIKNRHYKDTDYGPGESWVEVWKCPCCGTTFEEKNGYP